MSKDARGSRRGRSGHAEDAAVFCEIQRDLRENSGQTATNKSVSIFDQEKMEKSGLPVLKIQILR